MFHDYMAAFETPHMRSALKDLFRVLDETPEKRDPYLIPSLAEFPYVNGGLFADETIEIPMLTDEIRELLLVKASENFNWSEISPTIFGAIFTNPDYRRKGIAKELLSRVVEEARTYGCGTVQITASDMGVLLYTDFGFVKNGNFM